MPYQLILYQYDGNFGMKEWKRALRFQMDGHPVQELTHKTDHATMVDKMWIDFETEDDAALFKLTYW